VLAGSGQLYAAKLALCTGQHIQSNRNLSCFAKAHKPEVHMRKSTLALIAGAAVAAGISGKRAKKLVTALTSDGKSDARKIADKTAQRYMMYFGLPAWAIAGGLDWLWHRQTKIETTSGPKESVMHLLMMAESGISVLGGLFLEPNAGLFAVLTTGVLLHQATVIYDVEYTVSRRKIPAREQHTHSFMESLPFDIVAVFAGMYPEEFGSMLRLGAKKPDFSLRLRKPTIPLSHLVAIFSAITAVSALPHVEELWRCLRARRQGLTGTETPPCARELYAASSQR
jgi:hypothetical protein